MLYRAAKSIAFPWQERKPKGLAEAAKAAIPAHTNNGTYLLIGYVDKTLQLPKLCATGSGAGFATLLVVVV